MRKRKYIVYTDGASRMFDNRTRRVGVTYAVILQELSDGTLEIVREVSGVAPGASNNRSEMLGPLIAIDEILEHDNGPKTIHIYTDSTYVVSNFKVVLKKFFYKGLREVNDYYPNWDLWGVIGQRKMKHDIKMFWVKGHNGDYYNEHCDTMCDAIYNGEVKATYKLK